MSEHDPTGLELAADIAGQTARSAPILPPVVERSTRMSVRRRTIFEEQRSGAKADARDPQLIGDVLRSVSAQQGWTTHMSLALVLRDWSRLVGPANAEHSTPTRYEDGILTVQCDSTAWATGMKFLAAQLVAKLNQELGHDTIRRVVFRGPKAPSWKKGPRSVRDGRGPRDTYG